MLGRLSLDAIPYDNGIIMFAVALMAIVGVVAVGSTTYLGKWGYLYKEWLTSVDHKKIGIMYIILAFVFLLRGFVDALMMRAQQATAGPGHSGYLPPEHFAELFTGHGTMMILFVAMPLIIGIINIAVPPQIGARDVAFPFMNSISLWLTYAGGLLIMASLAVGQFSTAGWTGYAPFSEYPANPSTGVDYWIWALQISGIGTTLTGINFLVTILRERAPGMTLMRMPIFTWTALITMIMVVLAFPALTVALGMLTLDRLFDFHFFTGGMGGNQMMYINMFWIWGHPEVYIVILPAFGVFSEVTATFCNKRLFGYRTMVYATMVIALLSFTVWVHHFFTMGQGPLRNTVFAISTMVIGIPTGVKIYNWMATMFRGRIEFKQPMLWTLGFILLFTVGGMTGVMLAIPGIDYKVHNSEFLVAHFHNVLIPGTIFGMFAGYTYWFPKAFGFRLDEQWGRRAFWGWTIGFTVAFMPLYVLGAMGMPRRMVSYSNPAWTPWLWVAAFGALIVLYGIACQVVQLLVSIKNRDRLADLTGDPWGGRTLEWAMSSPPAEYNFAVIPTVHGIDAFMEMKEQGTAYQQPAEYSDIHMPKSTPAGLVIGAGAFVFGFGVIWWIWWLAILGGLTMLASVIWRACTDDVEFTIPAAEVKRVEDERFRKLALAGQRGDVIDTGSRGRMPFGGDMTGLHPG
ncbi:cbb3-type cytochrome c oxidase subunit I [Salinisphaera sp.]|uniref:cbb3-type cytochrome c oxidase subunit I n=1 Tax=Salinisphaera sp. TaxID=1914330 RepID=UPI002D773675|nr:cbb3-type cytochrome c oxidase subunit I [Salinisphaera sp.]HET7314766.1 cbb3-type cytochrome c oxidase subunit I [Salinisphaera sp.]